MEGSEEGIRTPSTVSVEDTHPFCIAFFSGELPHESKDESFRLLHLRSKTVQHPLLASFIDLSLAGLRQELEQQPQYLKELFPPFENIIDVARCEEELEKGLLCGAIQRVTLCLLKLGLFIAYYECHSDYYTWSSTASCSLGMGVGMLMCGAVSMCPRLADLPKAAAETVRLAFRFGIFVGDFSRSIEPVEIGETPKKYVCAIMGQDERTVQTELDRVQDDVNTPKTSRVMICNVRNCSTSIDGPPERVTAIRNDPSFFPDLHKSRKIPMTAYGGICHAPDVYSPAHIQNIVHKFDVQGTPESPVLSLVTGAPYEGSNATELFENICYDVLMEPVRWEANLAGAVAQAHASGASACVILEAGSSNPMLDLRQRLQEASLSMSVQRVDLVAWIRETPIEDERPRNRSQSKLAIVGMSCRFPGGANGNEEFWDLLMRGADVHRTIPADRFDVNTHCDPSGQKLNATKTPYGCFIDDPASFDPHFFGMSPTEAKQTDPMHRLALVTAYEALEMAGHVNGQGVNPNRIGTFYGQASDDYREVNSGQEVSTYFINGGCRAFAPGKINYFFKFSGPSYSIDTACSSALAAIQEACDSLWSGNTDMVVAGGLNVLTNCDVYAGLSHGHFLSETGGCKTWDAMADGYCRADGVGSVVIKRLEDALDTNDNILGVVLSAATNHSANAISITHPHAPTQQALYSQVVSRAGIDPLTVGYVEMHGTGTQAGDLNETESITNVFAPLPAQQRARREDQPLYIGTVKANMGHGEAAAGSMALTKALLVLQHGIIPPHIGIKTGLSARFPKELERRNLHIPFEAISWQRNVKRLRRAVVNNFGAAGGNTTVILEEGPLVVKEACAPMTGFPFVFSAKGKAKQSPSLQAVLRQYIDYLDANPTISPADLSYTLCARRMHHTHRVALTASTTAELKRKLTDKLAQSSEPAVTSKTVPKVAFVFTGQGSFYNGMAKELYDGHDFFRRITQHLDYVTTNNGFPSILPVFEGRATEEQEASAVVQQLAILVSELALIRFWEYLGVKPDIVIGHSLGEYAALCAAGVLTSSEAIFLVGSRARILEQTCAAGAYVMLAIRASTDELDAVAEDIRYDIACINGPNDTVVAGPAQDIQTLSQRLKVVGIKSTLLDIPYAFHSAQMDPILANVHRICSGLVFRKPLLKVISPLLNAVISRQGIFSAEYIVRATREAVDFVGALRTASESGDIGTDTVFLELGPRPICSAFVKSTLKDARHVAYSLKPKEDNWASLASSMTALYLAGVPLYWRELYRPFENQSLTLLDLPRYPWNNQRYWIQYRGDWCLTKGSLPTARREMSAASLLASSTVQRIVEEHFEGNSGRLQAESNVLESDFLTATEGHKMNNVGVVSSFLHGDAAYAIAKYWHQRAHRNRSVPSMELTDFSYHDPVVAQRYSTKPQIWKIAAHGHSDADNVTISFFNPRDTKGESNAHATVRFGKSESWLAEWAPWAYLISSRIDQLRAMAIKGQAIQVNKKMAYMMFAKLVDYSHHYRNMDSVILHDLEAVAEITLPNEAHGDWEMSPYCMDAFASLPGFILNGGDAVDNDKFFYLTPAWQSMRVAKPLMPGGKYQSYVKMVQDADEPRKYRGDVYMLQSGEIIGQIRQIEFWAWKRSQLPVFFRLPDADLAPPSAEHPKLQEAPSKASSPPVPAPAPAAMITPPLTPPTSSHGVRSEATNNFRFTPMEPTQPDQIPQVMSEKPIVPLALQIIARETELQVSDLDDDAQLADLGIDSMMSLELAGLFRSQLNIEIRDSFFAELPRIGDLKRFLSNCHGN